MSETGYKRGDYQHLHKCGWIFAHLLSLSVAAPLGLYLDVAVVGMALAIRLSVWC